MTGTLEKGESFAMAEQLHTFRLPLPVSSRRPNAWHFFAPLLLTLAFLAVPSSAQTVTTTISGTVYDPRTTTSSLPLPNVLVYATTSAVDPLTPGVQCLTSTSSTTPSGAVSFTNTAVDGTFTLANIPVNTSYTLVIQAGKWRRQFTEAVAAAPLTGLALHMPSDHTQGDIPLIAVATGSVDALECVLKDMGMAATEFTDDNGTSGGRIHLYKGSASPGADINASTPLQSTLMSSAATLNNYDVVMFPCQGSPGDQTSATAATNLFNYANAGGRVFATHYSNVWINPNSPYNSLFPPVANWTTDSDLPDGEATINTGFNDGSTLAQWLLNAGASTTFGQVALSTLRIDLSSVIPPTQSWATLNSNKDVMQMTFNAPVGAPAANQCGRVLFNEYHVYNASSGGKVFPAECGTTGIMSPQEEMLEYALFDLSSFVTPVVVPSLTIAFTPNPLVVNQGDTADQLVVDVTNTSTSNPVDGSAVLTLNLPSGLTPTAITDSTNGWTCTLATLACTRTSAIPAGASDSVTLTISVPAYPAGGPTNPTSSLTATVSSPSFSNNVTATDTVIFQVAPPITWPTPANMIYGTPLSGVQLDATSTIAGAFVYTPPAGTVLPIGTQTLSTVLTPTDAVHYTTAKASVSVTVIPATPSISLNGSPNPAFLMNPVTLSATVSSTGTTPTGSISFYDGTTSLGTGTMTSGTTSALTIGSHAITAVYSGDTNYQTVTSAPFTETIEDFSIAVSGSGTSTAASGGSPASFTFAISPVGGPSLAGPVTLSVTGLPVATTAVFTPVTLPTGSASSTVLMEVLLPGQTAAARQPRSPFKGAPLPIALGLLCLLPFAAKLRKTARRLRYFTVFALLAFAMAAGLNGCGVTNTPVSFPLTVTGASGPLSHNTTVKLIVKLAQ